MHNIFCNISAYVFLQELTEHRKNIRKRIHYVVVALTLLDRLPTVGSVDGNVIFCSTAYGLVAIYSCTVCLDLLLMGIPSFIN